MQRLLMPRVPKQHAFTFNAATSVHHQGESFSLFSLFFFLCWPKKTLVNARIYTPCERRRHTPLHPPPNLQPLAHTHTHTQKYFLLLRASFDFSFCKYVYILKQKLRKIRFRNFLHTIIARLRSYKICIFLVRAKDATFFVHTRIKPTKTHLRALR